MDVLEGGEDRKRRWPRRRRPDHRPARGVLRADGGACQDRRPPICRMNPACLLLKAQGSSRNRANGFLAFAGVASALGSSLRARYQRRLRPRSASRPEKPRARNWQQPPDYGRTNGMAAALLSVRNRETALVTAEGACPPAVGRAGQQANACCWCCRISERKRTETELTAIEAA